MRLGRRGGCSDGAENDIGIGWVRVLRAVALRMIQTLRDQPVKGSGSGKG